jgi:hypothetical protein
LGGRLVRGRKDNDAHKIFMRLATWFDARGKNNTNKKKISVVREESGY